MQEDTLRWAAARANGAWWEAIKETLGLLHDLNVLSRLNVSAPRISGPPDLAGDVSWLEEETNTLQKLHDFTMQLASFRAWSQVQFTTLVPQMLAAIHHVNVDCRETAMQRLRRTWDCVLKAEAFCFPPEGAEGVAPPARQQVKQLLQDMSWHRLQLAREIYSVAAAGSWSKDDSELRLLAFYLWGRPAQTKYLLEDVFSHLADAAARQSKNQAMQRCLVCN